jgi:hypothetical protein
MGEKIALKYRMLSDKCLFGEQTSHLLIVSRIYVLDTWVS